MWNITKAMFRNKCIALNANPLETKKDFKSTP